MTQTDLFGHTARQGSLFGNGEDRMQAPEVRDVPDPDVVRQRMLVVLEKARAAETMPWNKHDAEVWQLIFPNMANWLPEEEGQQLVLAFEAEMLRLKDAA